MKAGMKFCNPEGGFFNTSTGNYIIASIPGRVSKALKKETPAMRFDSLLGLTYGLNYFDVWMHDNEMWDDDGKGEVDIAVKKLARAWRTLLALSDTELGVDSQYTRPGVESLLQDFADSVDNSEAIQAKFKWSNQQAASNYDSGNDDDDDDSDDDDDDDDDGNDDDDDSVDFDDDCSDDDSDDDDDYDSDDDDTYYVAIDENEVDAES